MIRASRNEGSNTLLIAIVKDKDISEYNSAMAGFREFLGKENITAQFEIYDEYEPSLIAKLKALKPDLILTMGAPATNKVAAEIKEIPIVFSVVMDPRQSGITSKNIYGASVDIPVKIQLEMVRSVVPKLNRIGVVYNPAENETVVQEARTLSKELGFTLNTYPVNSEREIPPLRDLPIDVLWIVPDSIACKDAITNRFLQAGVKYKIAVVGFSRYYAKAGALLGIACDYKDIGRQSAEIAIKVLKGAPNSDLKISVPRIATLYLNKTVAKLLGITFPETIIKKASEVY